MFPRARRLTTTLGALVATGVFVMSAFAGGASAAGTRNTHTWNTGASSSITSITLTKNDADMKRVAEYWNPARLKQAQDNNPATPEVKPSNGGTASSAPVSPTPTGTAADATAASGEATPAKATSYSMTRRTSSVVKPTLPTKKSPSVSTLPKTVGKVFFKIGNKEYWCSASAVASRYHNLVATAGHCAYDAKQGLNADYWIFIPGYNQGRTPYGIYVGHSLNLHESFTGRGDYDYDYAFVTVHDGFVWKPGKTPNTYQMESVGSLEDNVGGQGLMVNRGVGLSVFAFGYPAAPHIDGSRPYDGQKMLWCDGRTYRTRAPTRLVETGVSLGCTFTGGASGGPWLIEYDPQRGVGYLNGVNSFAWDTDTDKRYDRISSPYFTQSTYVVYEYAERQQSK
ncbi:serine protease [Streptosporangium sp. NPDC051022]|uniref:trypsin-like serine peptidase n=1 Tax=Streptosporangium sp. NPDC051022 TaxID=3155752 RepID=UPI003423ADB2